jgi:dihydroxyacid dehydratase/phosphogluconate dehydratase
MPEVGNMPLPRKLLERGIKDMVRISDARMSGTAFEHVTQADRGCDLDFLVGSSGSTVERESH